MMEQITLEQFRRTVRIRLRLLRVFILLCAAAVFCAHFWGHRGGVPGARFPYYADLLTGADRTWFQLNLGQIPGDFPLKEAFPLGNADQVFFTDRRPGGN